MTKKDKLHKRTMKIISRGGVILLKKDGWYLSCWTNIAGGPDTKHFASREYALPIDNLQWAFALAPLYNCKIVSAYPKKKERLQPLG